MTENSCATYWSEVACKRIGSECVLAISALWSSSYTTITRPKPGNGTHWLISPYLEKCSRRRFKMRGSKKDLGNAVTITVFVACNLGGDLGGDWEDGRDI